MIDWNLFSEDDALRLSNLLNLLSQLELNDMGFIVGYLAAADIDKAIEAYSTLMSGKL
jgi:hypothetical protein